MALAPNFGVSGATSRRRSRTGENLIFRDGFEKTPYFRREGGSIAETQETITAWGIQGSGLNPLGKPLESVTLTETEEVVVHDTWTGNQPTTGASPTKLVGVDAILIVSAERRLTITGYGALPDGYIETSVGKGAISLSIQSAIGAAVVSLSNAYLSSVSDDANLTDFTRWTLEFVEFISPNEGDDGSAHLITATIPDDVTATKYTISKTTSLGREAFVTVETSIEEHFGTAQANPWVTT